MTHGYSLPQGVTDDPTARLPFQRGEDASIHEESFRVCRVSCVMCRAGGEQVFRTPEPTPTPSVCHVSCTGHGAAGARTG